MKTLRAWIVRLCRLFGKKQHDRELTEELESHLAMHIEDNLRSGMDPEEARRNALIKLGGLDKTFEEYRDRQGFRWAADMQRNFRYAFRRLAKAPLLSLVVILSLGLGIGTNTAFFSVIYRLLLRSLPVEKPDELAMVTYSGAPEFRPDVDLSGGNEFVFTYPGFRELERRQQPSVAKLAGFKYWNAHVNYGSQAISGQILMVSGGYFPLMRVQPFMGRALIPADDQGAGNPVAMLGYSFWKNKLGGQMGVLNQPIHLFGRNFTIVGVAPKGFYGTTTGNIPDVIIPLAPFMSLPMFSRGTIFSTNSTFFWMYLVARINPGVTREQAAARYADAYAAILEGEIEAGKSGPYGLNPSQVKQLRKSRLILIDGSRGYSMGQHGSTNTLPLYILMAATGLVLLIAMANAANLLLARSAARRRELAICAAIGANRGKIVGQLLTEALALAMAGGVAGIAFSLLTLHFLNFLIAPLPKSQDLLTVQLEWPVLLYGLGLSLLTGLLFGLYPALEAAQIAPIKVLNQESGHISETLGSARVRKTLVCAQVVLSAILLVPTGLFLKSLVKLMNVDIGLRTENQITFYLNPDTNQYTSGQRRMVYERVERELAAIPGVIGVTSATKPLISSNAYLSNYSPLIVEGYTREKSIFSQMNEIAPAFFGQMGIPLIMGREFTERDDLVGQRVAIVNEQFAQTYFAGQNPIGRKIAAESGPNVIPDIEIVGMVKYSHFSSVKQKPEPIFYLPWRQNRGMDSPGSMMFYVRSALPSSQVIAQVRKVVQALDESIPLEGLRTMEDEVTYSLIFDRLIFQLAGTLAALATALAMMGLYGVMAYSVIRRTREIGIRMAIGAKSAGIRQMVLREMMLILAIGLVLGIPAALAISKVVESQLFGVKTYDPLVVAGASLALGLAAFAAAYLPAWRASHIDPLNALRCE
jgi:putative ABC transport system permease protein